LPPPDGIEQGVRALGLATWSNAGRPVRLSIPDSRCHLHLLGSTGTGKTTTMLNLAAQDIAAGAASGFSTLKATSSAGSSVGCRASGSRMLCSYRRRHLAQRGINPLELWPGDDRYLVADNVLAIFRRIYERFWGPRTDDVLKCALLTLLERPNSTSRRSPPARR